MTNTRCETSPLGPPIVSCTCLGTYERREHSSQTGTPPQSPRYSTYIHVSLSSLHASRRSPIVSRHRLAVHTHQHVRVLHSDAAQPGEVAGVRVEACQLAAAQHDVGELFNADVDSRDEGDSSQDEYCGCEHRADRVFYSGAFRDRYREFL